MKHFITLRRALGALAILASIAFWIPASDVLRLVIERDPVLLGRYSLDQFGMLATLTPLLWLMAGLLLSSRRFDRVLAFQTITITGSCLLGLLLVAIVSSMVFPARYEVEHFLVPHLQKSTAEPGAGTASNTQENVVHRKPGLNISFTYDDIPPGARSYPNASRGYPRVTGTLTTDSRGFRNRQALHRADVVVVGDSFTEGYLVSDDDAWPEVLARSSQLSVYNLGISGLGPNEYLNNFVAYGLALKPRILILMFYEDNDFVQQGQTAHVREARLLADSPLVSALRKMLLWIFGPINANAQLPPSPALSLMPAAVSTGGKVHHYTFGPSSLIRLMVTHQEFIQSAEWEGTTKILRKLRRVAQENDIRFILAYAPSVPHVTLPLIRNQATDEALHAFAAFKKHDLPPPTRFADHVYARLDTKESTLYEFCQAEGIEFVSMTSMLRARMAAGEQVYFTYDPYSHWSPLGQHAVGEALARYLQ